MMSSNIAGLATRLTRLERRQRVDERARPLPPLDAATRRTLVGMLLEAGAASESSTTPLAQLLRALVRAAQHDGQERAR